MISDEPVFTVRQTADYKSHLRIPFPVKLHSVRLDDSFTLHKCLDRGRSSHDS